MSDLITIIIPTYNNMEYIERSIKSVINQTYLNLEIIIVDDGSDDGTTTICNEWLKKDKRITLYKVEHGGVCKARKYAVRQAKGQWIGFVDGDDWIDSNYYQELYEASTNMDLVSCGYTKELSEGGNRRVLENCTACIYTSKNIDEFYENMMHPMKSMTPMLWNKLLKTTLLQSIMDKVDENLTMASDAVMTYTYMLQCTNIKILEKSGYHYRENFFSLSESEETGFLYNVHLFFQNMKRNVKDHAYEEVLVDNIKRYTIALLKNRINYKLNLPEDVKFSTYYYPWYGRLEGKRVILYGAGEVGQEYYRRMRYDNECQIILWVDRKYLSIREKNIAEFVDSPDKINNVDWDYIIIAVKEKNMANDIKKDLVNKYHVNEKNILWNKTKQMWD